MIFDGVDSAGQAARGGVGSGGLRDGSRVAAWLGAVTVIVWLFMVGSCANPAGEGGSSGKETPAGPETTDPTETPETETVVPPGPALTLVSFSLVPSAGGTGWIQVRVNDRNAIAGAARVGGWHGTDDVTIVGDMRALGFWQAVSDGDEIRIWSGSWAGAADSALGDNTAGVWDVGVSSAFFGSDYGAIFVADETGILDLVAYTTEANAGDDWFDAGGSSAADSFLQAVENGFWSGSEIDSALSAGTLAEGDHFSLKEGLGDGSRAVDWERHTLAIQSVSASPERVTNGAEAEVRVNARVSAVNAEAEVFADFSALGGGTAVPLTEGAQNAFTAEITIPAGTAAGTYGIGIIARGAGIERTATVSLVVAEPEPQVRLDSIETDFGFALAGHTVTARARASGLWGGEVSGVTLDLSGLGLGEALAMERDLSDDSWIFSFTIPEDLPNGEYGLLATAFDSARGLSATSTIPAVLSAGTGVPAFANGDCEAINEGTEDDFAISDAELYEGSSSIWFVADVGSNKELILSGENMNALPETPKYLTFRFKGSAAGEAPGLRFQVASGGSERNYFDLNGIVSGTDYEPPCTVGVVYSKQAFEVDEWTLVKLNLESVEWDDTATADTMETGPWDYPLMVRVRSPSVHGWYVDDFRFTNQ